MCQELERMFNNYWWSSGTGGSRGTNWLSWNNISMSKRKGGLGFRNLYGFNIALMGKHCWNFMQNQDTLVSRVYKARYFPDSHFLKSAKGRDSSFIWNGIWTAKEELKSGFRWVVGDGNSIVAVKDPWIRRKSDYRVERSPIYEGRNEMVSNLFYPNSKQWDVGRVQEQFLEEDAKAILAIQVPHCNSRDRIVWANTTNGFYTAKAGYHLWHALNIGTSNIPQGEGWGKIWRLLMPHKVKIFIWRFCRNTVPTRRRLSGKGISVPWICPMCNTDVEHLAHLFFDCEFAVQCWSKVDLAYDMRSVEDIPGWLVQKLANAPTDEIVKICVILWGIWFWRNKRVWENKVVTPEFAVEGSFKVFQEWKEAKRTQATINHHLVKKAHKLDRRWNPPAEGALKLNVDASVFPGAETFSLGMLIRDHEGRFLAGRTLRLASPESVFEAETIGVKEALSWLEEKQLNNEEVQIETDSMLTEQAINRQTPNVLEVGDVVRECCMKMSNMIRTTVIFIRKQANKAAHELARYPCFANHHVDFMSPPSCLLETLVFDSLK